MALNNSPLITTDGLVLSIDASDPKSTQIYENLIPYSENILGPKWSGQGSVILDPLIFDPNGNQGTVHYVTTSEKVCYFDGLGATSLSMGFYASIRTGSGVDHIQIQFYQQVSGTVVDVEGYNFSMTGANADATYVKNVVRTDVGNGWFKFTFNVLANTGSGLGFFTDSSRVDIEGGVSSNYIWGLQASTLPTLGPYIKTTGYPVVKNIRNTTILDTSGNKSHVTLYNAAPANGVIAFNGTTGYGDFAANLGSTNVVTVEVWTRVTNISGMMFGWLSYDVYMSGGVISFNTSSGDKYGITAARVTQLGLLNNWAHYVFVMRSDVSYTNNKIYINGVSESLSQISGSENTSKRNFNGGVGRLSGWRESTTYPAGMTTAAFRIYNRELTQTEINQNYAAFRSKFSL